MRVQIAIVAVAALLATGADAVAQQPCTLPCSPTGSRVQNFTTITFNPFDLDETSYNAFHAALQDWMATFSNHGVNIYLNESSFGTWHVVFDESMRGSGHWASTDYNTHEIHFNPEALDLTTDAFGITLSNALHEVGHILGLDDVGCNGNSSVMGALASQQIASGNYATYPTSADDCGLTNIYQPGTPCPIVFDLRGDGVRLSGPAVKFDIRNDGTADLIGWVFPGTDDAFLVLDRDGNGAIDNGSELFGNYTPLPATPWILASDGWEALAEYDSPRLGGNGDGAITSADSIYHRLRLWIDENADGISTPNELHPLWQLGIRRIDLNAVRIWQTDSNGNVAFLKSTFSGRDREMRAGTWFDFFLVDIR